MLKAYLKTGMIPRDQLFRNQNKLSGILGKQYTYGYLFAKI